MIHVLKSLFEHAPQESEESRERNLRLAAAALLVETARADFNESSIEIDKLTQLLPSVLELEPAEVHNLVSAAYADGDVDKYEEHLIRNVADLIYVPHSNYIHCKLAAQM